MGCEQGEGKWRNILDNYLDEFLLSLWTHQDFQGPDNWLWMHFVLFLFKIEPVLRNAVRLCRWVSARKLRGRARVEKWAGGRRERAGKMALQPSPPARSEIPLCINSHQEIYLQGTNQFLRGTPSLPISNCTGEMINWRSQSPYWVPRSFHALFYLPCWMGPPVVGQRQPFPTFIQPREGDTCFQNRRFLNFCGFFLC